jgi:RNA polymerase sigma factor (sigma-70 family)
VSLEEHTPLLLDIAHVAARSYIRAHPTAWRHYEEFRADALFGACQAARRWDPDGWKSLGAWCWQRATGAILDGVRQRAPLPIAAVRRGVTLDTAPPAMRPPYSLNELVEGGYEQPAPDVYEAIENAEVLRACLQRLSDREREVIIRCNLRGDRLREVAEDWGVTLSRVCQIRTAAMRTLREAA